MHIDGFRAAAERPNAIVVVDTKSAQVTVRNNHVLNRVITWVRERFMSGAMRDAARVAPRNRFLQAIAHRHSGYNGADVSRARDLLATDLQERRPLSSRRIREVLDDLDGRSSATTRVNRSVVSIFQDETGRPATLAVRDLGTESQRERPADTLSLYGDGAGATSPGPTEEPSDFSSSPETGAAREGVMAEALDDPAPATGTQSSAVTETLPDPAIPDPPLPAAGMATLDPPGALAQPSPTAGAGNDAVADAAEEPASGARIPVESSGAGAVAGTAARKGMTPKQLTQELRNARLPPEVEKPLKKMIADGRIVDSQGLAKQGNRRLAEWVEDQRVGKWYVEALNDKGIKRMAKRGGTLYVPIPLCRDIERSITDSPVLRKYSGIKTESRGLIAAYVRKENEEGTLTRESVIHGDSAPEPRAHRARKS